MTNLGATAGIEELVLVLGMVGTQVVYGSFGVFLARFLATGISPLLVITLGCMPTSLFLSPFAVIFERSKWPGKLSLALVIQLLLVSMGGVALFQVLLLMGIRNTSPAVASAMPNLAPGIIFLISGCLRLEKVDIKCKYTAIKLIGTLVCLGGALAISFSKAGPITFQVLNSNLPSNNLIPRDRLLGDFYLLTSVLMSSFSLVLQAYVLRALPAPLTVGAITTFIGSLLAGLMHFIFEGKLDLPKVLTVASLVIFALVAGVMNGLCVAFHAWAVKQRGPVFVSMFSPINTVCTAVLSALTLGEPLGLLSVVGMALLFTGLYSVLWAKKKEGCLPQIENNCAVDDPEKPLLR